MLGEGVPRFSSVVRVLVIRFWNCIFVASGGLYISTIMRFTLSNFMANPSQVSSVEFINSVQISVSFTYKATPPPVLLTLSVR